MASEQIQGPGHAHALATIDGLIQEIDSNLPRVNGTTGVIVTDQQTARILRVLRIMRDEIASLIPDEDDDPGIMGGGITGPFVDDEGNPL